RCVRSSILHTISLAQFALAYTRGWAVNCPVARVRLKARLDRANQEIALLREQIRICNARMEAIAPHRRPHYPPAERLAILELKTARGWSLARTAKAFLITAATVASWMRRLDDEGPDALVQQPAPVNRFPDFVRYTVQRLKTLCPAMGRVKMAQTLARAGLHLGSMTVRRILQEKPCPEPTRPDTKTHRSGRVVTANRTNHVWHVDLTTVPVGGFWTNWLPFSLPQRWPFCWWVAVAVDHYSRRVMGCAAFDKQPTSEAVRHFLGRTIAKAKQTPKYLVCDRGVQFDCRGFREWCKRKGIKPPRYGAVGKHGSIAVVERCILTVKTLLACLPLVPYRREAFKRELDAIVQWYNEYRPHEYLGGKTPSEVYFRRFPANRRPRYEPRRSWPRGSPCARPWALVPGRPGARVTLEVRFLHGRKHLPIVGLKRAA
ncbi:MAG TPA: hypothetical protein DD670_14350, partial [Planctomycetaceae bacterium]|nr:hypothetical protein [Planctomycetaceae bacterium]